MSAPMWGCLPFGRENVGQSAKCDLAERGFHHLSAICSQTWPSKVLEEPKSANIPNLDAEAKSSPTDISSRERRELQDLYRAPSAKPGKVAGKLGGGRDGERFAWPSHCPVPMVSIWFVATIKSGYPQ